jgi:hypothetical protein
MNYILIYIYIYICSRCLARLYIPEDGHIRKLRWLWMIHRVGCCPFECTVPTLAWESEQIWDLLNTKQTFVPIQNLPRQFLEVLYILWIAVCGKRSVNWNYRETALFVMFLAGVAWSGDSTRQFPVCIPLLHCISSPRLSALRISPPPPCSRQP